MTTTMTRARSARTTSFTLHCSNFGQLFAEQQKLFRDKLARNFPQTPEIYHDRLVLYVEFAAPVSAPELVQQLEMLIFSLRTFINPALQFELSLRV